MHERKNIIARSASRADDGPSMDIWRAIQRHRRVFLIGLPLCWLVAITFWMTSPVTYESSTEILVMRKNPKLESNAYQDAGAEDATVSKELLATHMRIIKSHAVVADAVRKHGLDQLPSLRERAATTDEAIAYVMDAIDVSGGGQGPSKDARVLNVTFRHTSPDDARTIVEAVYAEYREFLAGKLRDVNEEVAELIARAREELERELDEKERAHLQARREAPMLWNGEQGTNTHRTQFELVESELATIRIKITQLRARLEALKATTAELAANNAGGAEYLALIDEESATRVAALVAICLGKADSAAFEARQPIRSAQANTEYSELLTQVAEQEMLLARFGPNHPEVVKRRKQIAAIRAYLDSRDTTDGGEDDEYLLEPRELLAAYVRLLRQDLSVLERRQEELTGIAEREQRAAKELIDYELRDATIRKQIARKQELFDAVVERLRAINLSKNYDALLTEQLVPASVGRKIAVGLPLSLALATCMGAVLGIGVVLILEYCDPAFRDLEEMSGAMSLPIVTHVVDVRPDHRLRIDPRHGGGISSEVAAYHERLSREAEAFHSLRTQLFHMARTNRGGGDRPLVIECSSPREGDGKTVLTANLGVSIAQAGRRVLIIDCDMRKPRQHAILGLDRNPGLSDALSEGTNAMRLIRPTEQEHLHLLAAGGPTRNPAELLESTAFGEMLAAAREEYDFVLLDTPPVLTVTDPCVVAWRADGVLLTVRPSNARRMECLRAQEMLAGVGGNLIGVAVNGWDAPARFKTGKYAYAYRQGYADEALT